MTTSETNEVYKTGNHQTCFSIAMQGEGPAQQMTKASWQRPPPPPLDQAKDRLVFQQVCIHQSPNISTLDYQVELDHYIGRPVLGMPGASAGPVPVVRMFGVTK